MNHSNHVVTKAQTHVMTTVPFRLLIDSEDNMNNNIPIAPEDAKRMGENIRNVGGILQNLIVTKDGDNYGVAAGRKRRAGLAYLIERAVEGYTIDYAVPVRIVSKEDALLISTAENMARRDARPAEQFEAFKNLFNRGYSAEFIAETFSLPVSVVNQRMQLASLAPELFALFREDAISSDEMEVLTLADSHAAQVDAWRAYEKLPNYEQHTRRLRSFIVKDELDASSDPDVLFVTLEAYEAAGGKVRRNLFDEAFVQDPLLLQTLKEEKLEQTVLAVKAEGWGWVEVVPSSYSDYYRMKQIRPVPRDVTPEEAAQLEALRVASTKADAAMKAADDAGEELSDDAYEALENAQDAAGEALSDFEGELEDVCENEGKYDPAQQSLAGAFVQVLHRGTITIRRGYVRREDSVVVAQLQGNADEVSAIQRQIDSEEKKKAKGPHSEALVRRLTAHKTLAVQAELAANPTVALAILVERLVLDVFNLSRSYNEVCNIQLQTQMERLKAEDKDIEHSAAAKELAERAKRLRTLLPKSRDALLPALLEMGQARLLELLAYCTAVSINAISGREDAAKRLDGASEAVELDMSKWWEANETTYFSSVARAQIAVVVSEVCSSVDGKAIEAMKKAEAVSTAAKKVAGKKWLPTVLRTKAKPKAQTKPASKKTPAKNSARKAPSSRATVKKAGRPTPRASMNACA